MDTPGESQTSKTDGGSRAMVFFMIMMKSTKLLKVFKTAKILKPLITAGTMVGSILVYSLSLGLPMAIGLVAMLFIHELGHVVALKRKGLRASAPVFIPMIGAVIFAPDMGQRDDEAYMGIAGPLVGGLAASLLLLGVILVEGEPAVFSVIAYVALLLNLFNLIPIRPLDGGRVTQAVGPHFKYVGILLLVLISLFLATPGILLIWILVLSDIKLGGLRAPLSVGLTLAMVVMMVFGIGTPQPMWVNLLDVILATVYSLGYLVTTDADFSGHDTRPELPKRQKLLWMGRYAVLAALLVILMVINHAYLPIGAL